MQVHDSRMHVTMRRADGWGRAAPMLAPASMQQPVAGQGVRASMLPHNHKRLAVLASSAGSRAVHRDHSDCAGLTAQRGTFCKQLPHAAHQQCLAADGYRQLKS